MDLPEVAELRRWRIEPGDRLIVRVTRQISQQQAESVRDRVRVTLQLPDDFPVLVIGPDMSVDVASADEDRIREAMAEAKDHPGRIVTR